MARRPYYRVKYDEANGFEYPYYDIKFDKPDYIAPTPSITPTPSPTSIPCPDYVCLDFSEPSLQDYNGAYYEWTRVYKGATPKINCDGYYYGYKGTTLNGKSGLIYYDGSDWIATLFAPSTTINCNDDITATNPNYISERVLTSAVSQCEYTYYRPDFSSFSGGSEECIVPSPSVTPTISTTPSITPTSTITPTPSITITPSTTITPTPTPSASVPPVPLPLQYEVELSGGTDIVVLAPELYRSATFPYSSQTTDVVFAIDWGDGNDELLYFADSPSWSFKNHAYASGGTYTISVKCSNSIPWRALDMSATENKLHRITDWGNQFGQIASPIRIYFNGSDLESIPGDLDTTNMADNGLTLSFAQTPFTGDCTNFTGLGNNLIGTFTGTQFNQDISGWDVSNIKFFTSTFADSLFNQDISSWNITGATSLSTMFAATPFNQDLNSWDTSNVTIMSNTFQQTPYNQPLTGWTTSNVTNMSAMFYSATSFNSDITNWDVSNVTRFKEMFELASSFNQDIGSWNVSGATTMFDMFSQASSFNQDLSSWDVSNVTDFDGMFNQATSFNQSLANWDIRSATVLNNMLSNCGMSTANYDATLIGWEGAAVVPTGLTLGATNLTYTLGGAAETARTSLITTYGWTINGDSGV